MVVLPRVHAVELQLLALVMAARTLSEEGLDLPDNPSQLRDINYPKWMFGKSKPVYRFFQSNWFSKWQWLHYDAAQD